MVNVEPKANNSNLKTEEYCISNLSNFSAIFNLQSQNVRSRPLCTLLPEESSWTTLKMRRSQGFYFDKWFIIKRTHNSWFYTQHRNAQDCFCEKGLKSYISYCPHSQGILTQLLDILTTPRPLFQMMRACSRWRFVTVSSSCFNWYIGILICWNFQGIMIYWYISGTLWVDRICPAYCLASGHAG